MSARTVHCKREPFDVYVGRPRGKAAMHFGNPFAYRFGTKAAVVLSPDDDAILAYRQWLEGTDFRDVEQERRAWILANFHTLRGKVLACWCHPHPCHADVLVDLANRESEVAHG